MIGWFVNMISGLGRGKLRRRFEILFKSEYEIDSFAIRNEFEILFLILHRKLEQKSPVSKVMRV
jgi:hypothetical protein